MDPVRDCLADPSSEGLRTLTKDQLLKVAEHYNFDLEIPKVIKKDDLVACVMEQLTNRGVFPVKQTPVSLTPMGTRMDHDVSPSLTFDQQVKLLEMKAEEREKKAEESEKEAEEREKDRELEYRKMQIEPQRLILLS